MSFASLHYFLFLPVVFILYYLVPSRPWQNWILLLASYFFYGCWDYRFLSLILISSLLDYTTGYLIDQSTNPRRRKGVLLISLVGNLGLLGFFKYFNFFIESVSIFLTAMGQDPSISALRIILPVGISFYTFQTMSYALDIYRGQFRAQRNLVDYLAFVSFFPQLVAGPIERAQNLLPQFSYRRRFSVPAAIEGCRLILWGLFTKMVLADNLGTLAEMAYTAPRNSSGALLALGTVCFAFQIYYDFSAYSQIASGSAKLFGMELMRNFNCPYFSLSVAEFWRRWHISLSTWFRDYVYFPLGGSRSGLLRTNRNLMITFLLSGLWHGAGWNFILWGGLHGLFLVGGHTWSYLKDHGWAAIKAQATAPAWANLLRLLRTFFLVCVGWVLFRSSSVEEAWLIYHRILSAVLTGEFYSGLGLLIWQHAPIFLLLVLTLVLEWAGRERGNPLPVSPRSAVLRWLVYTVFFWLIIYMGTEKTADFIYFQF